MKTDTNRISAKEFAAFLDSQLPIYDALILKSFYQKRTFYETHHDVRLLPNALRVLFTWKDRRFRRALGNENFEALKRKAMTLMARRFHKWIWTIPESDRKKAIQNQFYSGPPHGWIGHINVGSWSPFSEVEPQNKDCFGCKPEASIKVVGLTD